MIETIELIKHARTRTNNGICKQWSQKKLPEFSKCSTNRHEHVAECNIELSERAEAAKAREIQVETQDTFHHSREIVETQKRHEHERPNDMLLGTELCRSDENLADSCQLEGDEAIQNP